MIAFGEVGVTYVTRGLTFVVTDFGLDDDGPFARALLLEGRHSIVSASAGAVLTLREYGQTWADAVRIASL